MEQDGLLPVDWAPEAAAIVERAIADYNEHMADVANEDTPMRVAWGANGETDRFVHSVEGAKLLGSLPVQRGLLDWFDQQFEIQLWQNPTIDAVEQALCYRMRLQAQFTPPEKISDNAAALEFIDTFARTTVCHPIYRLRASGRGIEIGGIKTDIVFETLPWRVLHDALRMMVSHFSLYNTFKKPDFFPQDLPPLDEADQDDE